MINSFVFTNLYYYLMVWSITSKENIIKLQLVQNYACRIVTNLRKYDHITDAVNPFTPKPA